MLMKRHLNTCYRLVWNHITGAFVVASELARARGKRGGVAVALSLAAVTSLPVLAADIVVHPGETVNGGTLVADICYVPVRGHTRFCGLNAWGCQKRSAVWLSHLPDVMASVSFIWMPAPNVCRIYPLSTGNQEQHEIINHGNSAGYPHCVAAGQY
ncbi:hypothetical protein ECDEC15C_4263 [Escherichia coli DEC15C]|nr:hypothetical protein ECDEC15C_4263 [Escherichia coli DEC15C]